MTQTTLGRHGPFTRLASLVGRYWLRRMLADGLPPPFHAPFHFLLTRRLDVEDRLVVEKIERLRAALARRENESVTMILPDERPVLAEAAPALARQGPQVRTLVRSLPHIAHVSSIAPLWGTFLYLCANANQATTILELGSCAGISGCYLASGKYCQKFLTIEGTPALAQMAETHLRQVANNVDVINSSFDEALGRILPTLSDGLDMVYVDGSKEKSANLRYFQRLAPRLKSGCVVAFDDIHWSPAMSEAWTILRRWEGFACTINMGRLGWGLWAGGKTQPKSYDLFNLAGLDLYRLKRWLEGHGTQWR